MGYTRLYMEETSQPETPTVESQLADAQISFAGKSVEPEVSAEDMIPEDIDDHIDELPLEKARELYDIYFVIMVSPTDPPLKDSNGFEMHFQSKELASEAAKKSKLPDSYVIAEMRSLKRIPGADVNVAL